MPNYYEELKKICIKANPSIEGRNTSVKIPKPFSGIINYKDTDITLADVLYAISKIGKFVKLDLNGDFLEIKSEEFYCFFNLRENVENQQEPVIAFLVDLLS